jgi:ABC-type transport system involved in cytochrome c biogenesis ATPase subunit
MGAVYHGGRGARRVTPGGERRRLAYAPPVPVLLDASALSVRRGRRTVLTGVDLELHAGEAIHLAGPNGSGKTSLLRVLAGLAAPRAGRVRRHGVCAFVPEKVALAPALRGGEWLRAMRGLRGLAPTDWRIPIAAGGLDEEVLARPAAALSKGMLQRLALVEALHAGCPLLLLDEAFAGLDAEGRAWLADEIAARLDEGAAALVTDHSGGADGRLRAAGALRLRDGRCEPAPALSARAGPRTVTVRAVHRDGRRLEQTVPAGAGDALLRALLDDGWHVEGLRP